jgi:hypothetical protein
MAMLTTGRRLPRHRPGPATVAAGRHGKTLTPGPTTKLPMPGRAIEESTGTGTDTGQRATAAATAQAALTAARDS